MVRSIIFFLLILFFRENSWAQIAASSSLRVPLESILRKLSNKSITLETDATGILMQRIMLNNPYQIFFTVDEMTVDKIKKNFSGSVCRTINKTRVILWSMTSKNFDEWKNDKTGKIGIANPELAPFGRATVEGLKKINLFSSKKSQIVWPKNVEFLAEWARLGQIHSAFVPKTFKFSFPDLNKGLWIELPKEDFKMISTSICLLKNEGRELFEKLIEKDIQSEWAQFGYEI